MSGLAEASGAGRWLRAGVGWGPRHPQCGTLPSPGASHSHTDLLLGEEWVALGTIFGARDLKALSLE